LASVKGIEEFLVVEEESVSQPEKLSKKSTATRRTQEKLTATVEPRVPLQVLGARVVLLVGEADRWDLGMIDMRLRALEVS
jgi:hypothetical protein